MNHLNPKGQNMRRILSLSSVIALTVMMSSLSYAQIIEFSFEDRGSSFVTPSTETFGSQIENTELAGLAASPVTITLNEDTGSSPDSTSGDSGDARPLNDRLQITVIAGTGTGADAHFNGGTLEFGIDSSGANPTGGSASDSRPDWMLILMSHLHSLSTRASSSESLTSTV